MESPLRGTAPDDCRLIETMGRDGDAVRYLPFHLDRMAAGAEALGYPFDRALAEELLSELPEGGRIRMTLGAEGDLSVTGGHLAPNPDQWRVMIAAERLQSDDLWLRVKSTNRALYTRLREVLPEGVDEYLCLNEKDEVCEGTITNIFITTAEGERLTPPVSSGLLPGVLRRHLLENGYEERVLHLSDLVEAREIHFGNALRGLIPAVLLPVA